MSGVYVGLLCNPKDHLLSTAGDLSGPSQYKELICYNLRTRRRGFLTPLAAAELKKKKKFAHKRSVETSVFIRYIAIQKSKVHLNAARCIIGAHRVYAGPINIRARAR